MSLLGDYLIDKAIVMNLKEDDIIDKNFHSECCKAEILFTETSGVYIAPGIYCGKCKKLLF